MLWWVRLSYFPYSRSSISTGTLSNEMMYMYVIMEFSSCREICKSILRMLRVIKFHICLLKGIGNSLWEEGEKREGEREHQV